MEVRVSKKFKKDWSFYLDNDWLDFLSNNITAPEYSADGVTAMEAFFIFDSYGTLPKCSEVELFKTVLNRKSNVNLQIRMWVDGFKDCMMPVKDYMETFKGVAPKWIEKAFCNQLKDKYKMQYPEKYFDFELAEQELLKC